MAEKVTCERCCAEVRVKNDGSLYKHPCDERFERTERAERNAIEAARAGKAQCGDCGEWVRRTLDGQPFKHPCTPAGGFLGDTVTDTFEVSDPAPTVEPMDDECEHPNGFTEHGCPCGASQPDDDDDDVHDFRDPVSPNQAESDKFNYEGEKGPWFGAMYAGTCDSCFDRIEEGDRIRADGKGGYECEDCGEDDLSSLAPDTQTYQQQASEAAKRHQALLTLAAKGPSGDMASLAFEREQDAAMEFLGMHPGPSPDAKPQVRGPVERGPLAGPAYVDELCIPAARGPMPTPDEFLNPAEPEPELNVSGQPPARRDYLKRYIVVDPELGDFRRTKKERKPFGITRATTFNKHAQNTIALNGWSKRNVVMGASLRPDILRRAHGLHHDRSKDEREALDRIVDELETAAGAKVAADEGTFLHEFCDQVDAGLKTWQDAPHAYQQDIKRYVQALADAGLEPVPGLIERTTLIREFGGVAGTFDRIFYHRPSGQYIIGDLKTGKTMKYAMDETECQLWTYAHGVNQTGIYDWNTDTWLPVLFDPARGPVRASEAVGVIVHMPVQGPEAGEVYLRYADLERGRAYAELNDAVKSYEKSKVRPFEMSAPTWEQRFAAVTSGEQATALWREAKAEGVAGIRLNELVDIARAALRGKG